MSPKTTSVWLPRVIFESALITVSILLALGLDEWRENRQTEATIRQAISSFLSEIRRNRASVEDAAPFNRGLYEVIDQRHKSGDIQTLSDFVVILDSYSAVVLQSTAWETALATGSLAKMDYALVTALSLTYGLQNRYYETNRGAAARLMNPQLISGDSLELAVYNSLKYLKDVTAMESELADTYAVAIDVIELNRQRMAGEEL